MLRQLVSPAFVDTRGVSLTARSFTVSSSGTFAATVPARGAIAIRVGQTITGPAKTSSTTPTSTPTSTMVQVAFAPTVSTVYGENVFVVGSIAQLGSWAAGSAVHASLLLRPLMGWLTPRLDCALFFLVPRLEGDR
jgi:hypothetical protein